MHFNSHLDVVETGEGWTVDPFGGEVKDGRIYGRGTCDMKGGLAASIIAAEVFADVIPDYRGAIEISGTADEETGGFGGVAYLAEKGYFLRSPGSSTSSFPSRSTRIASASAIAASGGRRSRPGGSPTARCRFLATAPSATWPRCCAFEDVLFPALTTSTRRCR